MPNDKASSASAFNGTMLPTRELLYGAELLEQVGTHLGSACAGSTSMCTIVERVRSDPQASKRRPLDRQG